MRRNTACLFLFGSLLSLSGMAQTKRDSTQAGRNYMIDEVVVTGTRNETDVRHLPMTISVVSRQQIEKRTFSVTVIDGAGAGIIHYQSWRHGIWCIRRSCGRYEPARYRW